MLLTFKWLNEFIELSESPEKIAELLTNIGLEVESLRRVGPELGNEIVTAKIESIYTHPNASRLVLCDVFDGEKLFKIVCGAKNMAEGDIVALARHGAVLPKTKKFPEGITIEKTKLRGELSEGMLCSENELGIGDESEGIIILNKFNTELGKPIGELLELDDTVFELGITPNRPDCLSVLGIARELSAALNRKLKLRNDVFKASETINSGLSAYIHDILRCPRYACRFINNLTIKESPPFIKQRLETCGVRSINNVVDITNYVMLEYGHPLHAFDSRFIEGNRIVIRAARDGETIKTLDDIERGLSTEDLLICDASKPVAIAGVMGGENSQVLNDTKSIILECAYFDPVSIRKTSKRLRLSTESSYRFERGTDPNGVEKVIERVSFLLNKYADAEIEKDVVDIYPELKNPCIVSMNIKKMNDVLGTKIRKNKVDRILGSLGLRKTDEKRIINTYEIPTFRADLVREIDLVEEVARIYGYNSIPDSLPSVRINTVTQPESKYHKINALKKFVSSIGYSEVINYSFVDPELIKIFNYDKTTKLLNPISLDLSVMRPSLIPGLIQNIRRNINHQQDNLRLFEIGKTYNQEKGHISVEFYKLSTVSTVDKVNNLWDKRKYDYFDLKGDIVNVLNYLGISNKIDFDCVSNHSLLHPGNSSAILINDVNVGLFGELHPDIKSELDINKDIYLAELSLDTIFEISGQTKISYSQVTRNPYLKRDLTLVVGVNISAGDIICCVNDMKNDYIRNVEITDVYNDRALSESGKKSLSISITLMSDEKTLTDEEANLVQSKTLDRIKRIFNAELRS